MFFINNYEDSYYKKYLTRGWSPAHLLCLVSLYLVLALPFYFSFAGQNFWLNEQSRPLTTTYNYTGFYAIQVNYENGATTFTTHQYSNIPDNAIAEPPGFTATLSVSDLSNYDSTSLTLTGYSGLTLLSVNVIMYYRVAFQELGKEKLVGMMWSVKGNVQTADLAGSIRYQNNNPINGILSTTIVNLPPYYPNLVGGFTFQALANQLATSSLLLSTSLSGNTLTTVSTPATRTFALNYEKQKSVVVSYYPSILEAFKFKFSTYFAFVLVFFAIFYGLFKWYVKEGIVECRVQTQKVQ